MADHWKEGKVEIKEDTDHTASQVNDHTEINEP